MQQLNHAIPVTALAAALLAGCASTPYSPLDLARQQAVRKLTVDCYWQHEGERIILGSYPVHSACRQWAQERVKVRMPEELTWSE